MIENGRIKSHSGDGAFWGNVLAFVVCFLLFLGCLYAMGFWELGSVWIPGLIAMGLAVLAFIIPQQVIGRSDTVDDEAIHSQHTVVRHHGH